jgi:hypothetical protein
MISWIVAVGLNAVANTAAVFADVGTAGGAPASHCEQAPSAATAKIGNNQRSVRFKQAFLE